MNISANQEPDLPPIFESLQVRSDLISVAINTPEVVDASYDLELNLGQVWPDGQCAYDLSFDLVNDRQRSIEILEQIIPTTLAWIEFYARANVRVRHVGELMAYSTNLYATTEGVESISGRRKVISDRVFLVSRGPKPEFQTVEQILNEGELRPDMAKWLGALVSAGRYHDRYITDLSTLL